MSPDGGAEGAGVGWDWEGPPWAKPVLQKRRSRAAAAGIAFEREVRRELLRGSGCDKKWGEQPWLRKEHESGLAVLWKQPDLFLPVGKEGLIVECKYRLTQTAWEEALEQVGWYSRLVEEMMGRAPRCLVVCKHCVVKGVSVVPLAELVWGDLGEAGEVLVAQWDRVDEIMLFRGMSDGID